MPPPTSYRIGSIDILRGIVMIVMALDHTRDFFHITAFTADPLDAGTTTTALYFTRWITHFCAPVFVMLSGVSAFLSSKNKPAGEASLFLIKRGIWLIIVELVLITLGLTFNPLYNLLILQVIWAIGLSMVILGVLMRISYTAVLVVGIILFFGHNALDYASLPTKGVAYYLLTILFTTRTTIFPLGNNYFVYDLYAVLPWTGIMLLGYCLGSWFQKGFPAEKRKRLLLITGSCAVLLFIVLRLLKGYGDPGVYSTDKNTLFSFLNTSKYPPSLQYSCMTLGPALIILALLENVQAGWTRFASIYGRVPFFYYVLHFYLIHSILLLLFFVSGYTASQIADPNTPFLFRPLNFGYGLGVVYLIWIGVIGILYFPCRWFNKYKMEHRKWWLSYL
ncbi:MAG: heparan-alpha-glucosaminide N-acetyltransferase domain-containing protein [Chitinophagaceae bacterium]